MISIVTGTVDRQQSLKNFVNSVMEHTSVEYELLIIDASRHPLEIPLPRQARVIPERPRRNYVAGYNSAFEECRGEFVCWMNDDAEVTPKWDIAACEFMKAHPEVGLGCLPFSDPAWDGFKTCELWGIPYANFGFIRRSIGNSIGWFDKDLTMYGSDNAITFKVLLSGNGVAPIKNSKIIHHRFKDNIRQGNQGARQQDTRTLTQRYHPQLRKITKNFWKLLPETEDCGYI